MKAVLVFSLLCLFSLNGQEITLLKLHSQFSTHPVEFSKKHFGKEVFLKAKITGISRSFDSTMYIISLNDNKGKIYVKPTEISEKIKDKIYDLRNQERKEIDAEIKMTLVKSEGESLLFANLTSIKLIPPPPQKKPEKKKDDKKKKKNK